MSYVRRRRSRLKKNWSGYGVWGLAPLRVKRVMISSNIRANFETNANTASTTALQWRFFFWIRHWFGRWRFEWRLPRDERRGGGERTTSGFFFCMCEVVSSTTGADFRWLRTTTMTTIHGDDDDDDSAADAVVRGSQSGQYCGARSTRNQLDNTRQHRVNSHQPATQHTNGPELPSCTAAGCSPVNNERNAPS